MTASTRVSTHLLDGDFDEAPSCRTGPRISSRAGSIWTVRSCAARTSLAVSSALPARRELDADAGRWLAVQARRGRVALAADFDASHVFQAHGRTVRIGAQHDVTELHRCMAQLAGHHHGCAGDGLSAPGSARSPMVPDEPLARSGCGWRCSRRPRDRLKPTSLAGSIQMRMAFSVPNNWAWPTPRDALDFRQHGARGVVAERDRVPCRIVRREDGKQQEVRARDLSTRTPCCTTACGKTRGGAAEAVLHVDLGQVGISAGLER